MTSRTALPQSWRPFTMGQPWDEYDAVLLSESHGRGTVYHVYERGREIAMRHRLEQAKAVIEERWGPQQWFRVRPDKVETTHYFWGDTTEFTEPVQLWVVEDLPQRPLEDIVEDVFQVLEHRRAGLETRGRLEFRDTIDARDRWQQNGKLVAYDDGETAGYLDYAVFNHPRYTDGTEIAIQMIEVYPAFQRRGIATALLDELHDRVRRDYHDWDGWIRPENQTPQGVALFSRVQRPWLGFPPESARLRTGWELESGNGWYLYERDEALAWVNDQSGTPRGEPGWMWSVMNGDLQIAPSLEQAKADAERATHVRL